MTSSKYVLDSSREYSLYVCSERAIPSVIDGLKNGQRMALWVLRNRAEKIKTVALSGLLSYDRIYVHGEASANNAISLLAAPYKNNICLIEGLGQFGSRIAPDGDGIGAPRYTEVRRSKAAEAFLYNDLDLVPLVDNYDGSNKKPEHFLPIIPTVLLNGISGVAVGWSTDILPRSLKSIIEATKAALSGQPLPTLDPYYEKYKITVASTEKPNQWEFSGHAEIVDTSTVRVTELPPGMPIESFRQRLIALEDETEIENTPKVIGFSDQSTETIDITIKMKRVSIKDWTEQSAIDFFKIKEKTTERIVVIDWNGTSIKTYENPYDLVQDFVQWRLKWYTKRFEKLLFDTEYELVYWEALRTLFDKKFPETLGKFKDKKEIENHIEDILDIKVNPNQLEKIINLPTYRWTIEYSNEVNKQVEKLKEAIIEYNSILCSPDKLKKVYMDELEQLKNFKG